MSETASFIKRAAERTGFKRQYYAEKNMPTHPSNVVAFPFFGDIRGCSILSSYILKSYMDLNPEKYVILCSWPGFQGLFPFVNEYWEIEDESASLKLATGANDFYNTTDLSLEITRNLIEVLDVRTGKDLQKLFLNGFTRDYRDVFGEIKRYLPNVGSLDFNSSIKSEFSSKFGKKVVIYPVSRMRSWQKGRSMYLPIAKDFWTGLIEGLLNEGHVPVVYQNWFTHDMSPEFTDRCVYVTSRSVSELLSVMRLSDLVLDIHSGISRLATIARAPFLAVDERRRYVESQDYILDGLCSNLPRQYIFSFSTMLMIDSIREWKSSLLDGLVVRLNKMLEEKNDLPSANELYEGVSFDNVRQRKAKRLGVTFINASKNR